MSSGYADRLQAEIEHFRNCENVHDLPDIFHVWSARFVMPKFQEVMGFGLSAGMEDFYTHYIRRYAEENPEEVVRIVSIGAGNGDLELRIGQQLRESGLHRFHFQCMDVNPAMLERGREAAAAAQMNAEFEFVEADASNWSPAFPIGVVIANHSLHHIQELEGTFANIKRAIGEKGYFLTADMIGRNGHMRWPEALDYVNAIWLTMPDRYKFNHQLKRLEETFENIDCSTEGFEGIRAQDILPMLVQLFQFEAFVAFGNVIDPFVDRAFGHNLLPSNPADVAFIERIGELNDDLISKGIVKPTQMIAVMRGSGFGSCRHYLHWTPEYCIRTQEAPAPEPRPEEILRTAPITGCGIQIRNARGLCDDGWLDQAFGVDIRLEDALEWIVIETYLPEGLQHEPEISFILNGAVALREKASAGTFQFKVRCQIVKGETIQLAVESDRTYSPSDIGQNADHRRLSVLLREIRLIPPDAAETDKSQSWVQSLFKR